MTTSELHAAVMNLQCPDPCSMDYRIGHRDARHAAAELVSRAGAELDALKAENERLRTLVFDAYFEGGHDCPMYDSLKQSDWEASEAKWELDRPLREAAEAAHAAKEANRG